jgi:sigma-B regulation protein RsbQ
MDRTTWAGPALARPSCRTTSGPALGEELDGQLLRHRPVVARRFAEATFLGDNRADLPQVRVPSLVLQCSSDIIAPRRVGEYVHRHLPGSTLRVMRATGHCPHMSAPEETITLMREWLAQAPAP